MIHITKNTGDTIIFFLWCDQLFQIIQILMDNFYFGACFIDTLFAKYVNTQPYHCGDVSYKIGYVLLVDWKFGSNSWAHIPTP